MTYTNAPFPTVRLEKKTYLLDRCSRCLADCPSCDSLDIDPLCTACIFDLAADTNFDGLIAVNSLDELAHTLHLLNLADAADPEDLPESQGTWRF